MIFRQLLHFDPVGASYLLGCGGHGVCAVVDPFVPVDTYLELAASTGMRIKYVVDTHVHADHLSGARQLAQLTGSEYVRHQSAAGDGITGVSEGERLTLGNVVLTVLHTPGHTPEHISLTIVDATRGEAAWAVLTGHTLMVGDMGRTELVTSIGEGAAQLWTSAERLKTLADHVEVWPGAFSGSVCGRGLSGKPSSTVGFERRFNRMFRLENRDEFIAAIQRDVPSPPMNAARIRATNLSG